MAILAALAASGNQELFEFYAEKYRDKPKRRSATKGETTTVVITAPVHGNLYIGSTHIESGQAKKARKGQGEKNKGTDPAAPPAPKPPAPPAPPPAPPAPEPPAPEPPPPPAPPAPQSSALPEVEDGDGVDEDVDERSPFTGGWGQPRPAPNAGSWGSPPAEEQNSHPTAPPVGQDDLDLELDF